MRVKDFFADEVLNNKKLYVDRRYSRVLYEHEWVLTQVIDAFLNSKEKTEFINRANNNLDRAKLVHMLGLKLELTGANNLIHRIANLIDQIVEDEMQYIPQLTALLKVKHEDGEI